YAKKIFKTIFSAILTLFLIGIVFSDENHKKSYKTPKACGNTKPILYKESDKSHRMVEIIYQNNAIIDCYLYGDKRLAENAIANKLCKPKVQFVEPKALSSVALQCSQWLSRQIRKGEIPSYSDEDFPDEYNNKIDRNFFEGILIFPGTKWCGAGDIAEHEHDFGSEKETDKCCRQHDYCFDSIESKGTKYNLTNKAIHTKSHCLCDQEFTECLKSVDKLISKSIAKLYFNLIQVQCFKRDHPIIECLEYKGIPLFWSSCQKYELDFTKAIIYQFFDAKFVDWF
ncbi:unnamed protein product, partial [Medioppia subpectinata]